MDEVDGLRKRYDEAASWALIKEPSLSQSISWKQTKKDMKALNDKLGVELKVQFEPLRISLSRNGKEEIVLNGRGLLHMEHFRLKDSSTPESEQKTPPGEQVVLKASSAWFEGEEDVSLWDEYFGGQTDTKPKGWFTRLRLYTKHLTLHQAPNLSPST